MLYEWIQHIEFANRWVLPFLLLLPLIVWLRRRARTKSSLLVSATAAFPGRTARNTWVHLPYWLRLLAIGCLILALARPQVTETNERKRGEGIDIILCIDVSGSMRARDFYPNRLDVAKTVAIEFVRNRPVDRIGLVIFEGESFTQAPLSGDHSALLEQIAGLQSGTLQAGTLIGEGLATSVERLSQSRSSSKVVILLTDGKEEAPATRIIDPVTALEIAKAKGVRVYTIGMGGRNARPSSEIGGRVTRGDSFLDEALLKRIAGGTGGTYFRATDRETLEEIYAQIDRLEKSEFEVVRRTRTQEYFVYFVAAALLLLAIELLLRYTLLRVFP